MQIPPDDIVTTLFNAVSQLKRTVPDAAAVLVAENVHMACELFKREHGSMEIDETVNEICGLPLVRFPELENNHFAIARRDYFEAEVEAGNIVNYDATLAGDS